MSKLKFRKIASLPAAPDRTWQSSPHPTLPLLATACSDKSVHLSNLKTYQPISTIDGGHKRSVRCVSWKPNSRDESVIATGSFDATAGIWRRWETHDAVGRGPGDLDGGEEEMIEDWRFAVILDGHENEVKSVAWSAGGSFLATCSRDKSVWIWEEMDEDNFETVAVLQEHSQDVKCVTWHPEEEIVASSSYDDTIRLWREDVDDWGCAAVLKGHEGTVWTVDFEKLGKMDRLVSCSDDLTVRVWRRVHAAAGPSSLGEKKPPTIFKKSTIDEEWVEEAVLPKAHTRSIYSVAWCKKFPGRIASCGGDGKLVVYEEINEEDAEKAVEEEKQESASPVNSVGKDHDVEMADRNGEEKLVGEKKEKKKWVIVAEEDLAHGIYEVNNVCWSKRWDKNARSLDEQIIISTGDDGVVSFWELVEEE